MLSLFRNVSYAFFSSDLCVEPYKRRENFLLEKRLLSALQLGRLAVN